MPEKANELTPGMTRKISLTIDGKTFTPEEAIAEAKNCYGIGNGVTLLAEQLVAGLLDKTGVEQYQNQPSEYIKSRIASAMYEIYLTGAALLAELEKSEQNRLPDILSKIPQSELEGSAPPGATPEIRFIRWMQDYDIIRSLTQDTGTTLQKLIERDYGGSYHFSKNTNNFNFTLEP